MGELNIEHLQSLYMNNIVKLFTANNFKELASHSNNIQGYSFMNRALLYIQNRYCTDVKSEMSWQLEGRLVNDKAVPMGIITPIIDTKYIETSSGREIKATELNPNEFTKAIMLGIITKETSIIDIKCTLVYDIRDTCTVSDTAQSTSGINSVRKIKLSTLLELLDSIGLNVVRDDIDKTTYDSTNNTLIIGNDELLDKVITCIYTLAIKYVEQLDSNISLSDGEISLLRDYMIYAVCTYFGMKSSIDFDYIDSVFDTDELDKLIELLDDIEHILSTHIFSNVSPSGYALDEGHKTYIAHKAAILLNILEANYEASELKGV